MSPAFHIAFLLFSATVVKSLEDQTDDKEDFPPLLKQERDGHHAELLQDGALQDLCSSCESLVSKVKKKMGQDTSKAKIAKLVEKVCSQENNELVEAACKKITGEVKDELCEAVANGENPKSVCKKVKLCKKKTPPCL